MTLLAHTTISYHREEREQCITAGISQGKKELLLPGVWLDLVSWTCNQLGQICAAIVLRTGLRRNQLKTNEQIRQKTVAKNKLMVAREGDGRE